MLLLPALPPSAQPNGPSRARPCTTRPGCGLPGSTEACTHTKNLSAGPCFDFIYITYVSTTTATTDGMPEAAERLRAKATTGRRLLGWRADAGTPMSARAPLGCLVLSCEACARKITPTPRKQHRHCTEIRARRVQRRCVAPATWAHLRRRRRRRRRRR
jgi:hypothetical protein